MRESHVATLWAVMAIAAGPAAGQDPARDALREQLKGELGGAAGFELVETGPLFVLTQVHEKRLCQELEQRVGLLQEVLERDFPFRPAEGADPPAPVVVRLFRDPAAYAAAGGPQASVNYVDAEAKRFLIVDRSATARRDFWRALAGLQFKAHWVRAAGLPWPHGWFLHGHEDYYAGFELTAGRLVRKPNPWRLETIRQVARQRQHIPFSEFLRWFGPGYHGTGSNFLQNYLEAYAQGWSCVWFLRTLPETHRKPPGWQPGWELILDRYLSGMRTARDRGAAIDAALLDIDLAALEDAWLASLE